jgi:hypothetical protein
VYTDQAEGHARLVKLAGMGQVVESVSLFLLRVWGAQTRYKSMPGWANLSAWATLLNPSAYFAK